MHLAERLNLAVHGELVAEDAVQIEQVEEHQSIDWIEDLVGEQQRDVEIAGSRAVRHAGQMEPGGLVAGVGLVVQEIKPGQPLVDVLRRERHAVIVVPQRAHGLVRIAARWIVRIAVVVELTDFKKIAGMAITFRSRVTVVKMG